MASSSWPIVHAERQALADDVASLREEQWSTGSLCPGWSVHDVLGHLTATAKSTPSKFFSGLASAGFRFEKMSAKNIARETGGTPADTLAEFRAHLADTTAPPGPADTWIGESIVHGEDIRRPLGITRTYPMDAVIRAADFYKRSNLLIGAKKRITGLTLRASDSDWATGSGPEVTGPTLSLLLAMTGRQAALVDLSGPGLATLQGRM